MTRLLLRAGNAPILILIVIFFLGVQTSLFSYYPLLYLQPDIVLLVVIWCALHRGFTEGGIITLILSDFAEIHSGAPQGLFLLSYMAVYLMIRGMVKYILLPHYSSLIGLTIIYSIIWKLITLAILFALDLGENQWRHTLWQMPFAAVVQAAIGIWVYRWLEKFDWKTFKDPRRRQVLEDELLLGDEGL